MTALRVGRRGTGLLLAALAWVVAPRDAGAQGPRRSVDNLNTWAAVVGEVELARRWFVDYDVQVRRHGPVQRWQQFLPRAGLRFQPTAAVRLTAGYALAESWPYGEVPAPRRTREHRLWEQLQLQHAAGRVALTQRYRLEQRWVGAVTAPGAGAGVAARVRSNRLRYRLQGTLPLRGATVDDGEPYLAAFDELFVQWGENVQANPLDQNRAGVSVGRRWSRRLRTEVGYMHHLVLKPNGRDVEHNHTLLLTVLPTMPWRR